MYDAPPHYQTFILKCWQERSEGQENAPLLRFSLEDTAAQVRYGFQSLEEMFDFLQQRCNPES